jgi:hypothetical protein
VTGYSFILAPLATCVGDYLQEYWAPGSEGDQNILPVIFD